MFFAFLSILIATSTSLRITPVEAERLAEKIWQNECNRSLEGLTSWNKGEGHASLGIGHFIWVPLGGGGIFEETFPELIIFLEKQKAKVPAWIKKGCPWSCEEEFRAAKDSKEMRELRAFLYETRTLQALFIAKRLEDSLEKMCKDLSPTEKERLKANFFRIANAPNGLYALSDYLNFKGTGTSPTEQYQGKGWGLKQALLQMDPNSAPIPAFIKAVSDLLTERVQNAPKERNEARWLKGWLKRVESY